MDIHSSYGGQQRSQCAGEDKPVRNADTEVIVTVRDFAEGVFFA